MRILISALFVGIVFGAGLALSDMVNPARVQAFLDIAGRWDPTLIFVMAAAIVPSAIGYLLSRRIDRPVFADSFAIPKSRTIDRPLLAGAALFGIGWGLVGFCPGPAMSGVALGSWQPWLFVAAMLTGMLLHRFTTTALGVQPTCATSTRKKLI